MNTDTLKKIQLERGTDTIYNKVMDEFAKKKIRLELIYT